MIMMQTGMVNQGITSVLNQMEGMQISQTKTLSKLIVMIIITIYIVII